MLWTEGREQMENPVGLKVISPIGEESSITLIMTQCGNCWKRVEWVLEEHIRPTMSQATGQDGLPWGHVWADREVAVATGETKLQTKGLARAQGHKRSPRSFGWGREMKPTPVMTTS